MPVVLAVAYTYEPDYRLTDGVADDGIATVQDLGLAHDLAGNITAIADLADDLVAIDMARRAAAAGPTAQKRDDIVAASMVHHARSARGPGPRIGDRGPGSLSEVWPWGVVSP